MVFFSKRDLTTYTSVSLAQDGVDLTKYWAAT